MVDPRYVPEPGETSEAYKKRVDEMTPPDFERKTDIGPAVKPGKEEKRKGK